MLEIIIRDKKSSRFFLILLGSILSSIRTIHRDFVLLIILILIKNFEEIISFHRWYYAKGNTYY